MLFFKACCLHLHACLLPFHTRCSQDILKKYSIPTAVYEKFVDANKAKVRA